MCIFVIMSYCPSYNVLLLTFVKFFMVKPLHTFHSFHFYILEAVARDRRLKTFSHFPYAILEENGRRCFAYAAPSFWNPLPSCDKFPLMPPKAAGRLLFKMAYDSTHWLLPGTSILFVTLWCFCLQAFWARCLLIILKFALYKCITVIIILFLFLSFLLLLSSSSSLLLFLLLSLVVVFLLLSLLLLS